MSDWIKEENKTKTQLMEEVFLVDAIDHKDMGTHVWVAKLNNRGTSLVCYATGKVDGIWHHKLITEDIGPDVYDCPLGLLEMCVTRNIPWRTKVMQWHEENS